MPHETSLAWMRAQGFAPDDINSRAKNQDTPLILASRRGEEGVVSDLLQAGADLTARNMDGTNALWAACVADSFAIADLLLEAGIDIDNQNDNGATVLMYAASNGRAAWVDYFLDKGADSTLRSLDDFSALDLASTLPILRRLKREKQERASCPQT